MNKDKMPRNVKGQAHGYWERYNGKGKLWYKCVLINGKQNGFEEVYWNEDGKVRRKNYNL